MNPSHSFDVVNSGAMAAVINATISEITAAEADEVIYQFANLTSGEFRRKLQSPDYRESTQKSISWVTGAVVAAKSISCPIRFHEVLSEMPVRTRTNDADLERFMLLVINQTSYDADTGLTRLEHRTRIHSIQKVVKDAFKAFQDRMDSQDD